MDRLRRLIHSEHSARQQRNFQDCRLQDEIAPGRGSSTRPPEARDILAEPGILLAALRAARLAREEDRVLLHERRNGQFLLHVNGVPWGRDRLGPIFLATLAIR